MKLTPEEISLFFNIILKKNPIVSATIENDIIKIFHFDGQSNEINLDTKIKTDDLFFPSQPATIIEIPHDYYEYSNSDVVDDEVKDETNSDDSNIIIHEEATVSLETEIMASLDLKLKNIDEKIRDYIKNTNSVMLDEINENIEKSSKNINTVQEIIERVETIENRYDDTHIMKLISDIQEKVSIQNETKPEVLTETITTFVENRYDDSSLREWVKSILPVMPNQIVKETVIENRYDDSILLEKISEIEKKASEIPTPDKRHIVSIEGRGDRIISVYNDDTSSDITETLFNSFQIYLKPMIVKIISSITSVVGADGESAYSAARRRGFVGTEDEWLNSLGGSGVSIPLPGEIIRDQTGVITSVIVGSVETVFNRDTNGSIASIIKNNVTKTFSRDQNGRISGWSVL